MHGFIFASYQRAIEIDPDGEVAHTNLGFAYQAQGHLDKAIALHKRAIELDPNYADAHSNLGIAHSEQGHLDMAIASYKRAIDIDQDGADAHGNLMNAHKAKADALEAEGGDPKEVGELLRSAAGHWEVKNGVVRASVVVARKKAAELEVLGGGALPAGGLGASSLGGFESPSPPRIFFGLPFFRESFVVSAHLACLVRLSGLFPARS